MKRLQAFKFQLIGTPGHARKLARYAGCARFVYNKALALQMERKEKGEKRHGYAVLCKILTDWRHAEESSFLAEAPTHGLQQSLKDLDRAFVNLYAGRAGQPRFKKRGRRDAFRYPDAKQIRLDEKNSRIFLPKSGWIRYRKSREVAGVIKQVTVSRSVDEWYVSIQTEQEVEVLAPRRAEVVGIDVGVARFATLSDGTTYMPVSAYRKSEKKLAKEQRKLARKQKYSANWRKHVQKVQKLHKCISDKRRDLQHKVSTAICKKHAVVVIEDLNVKGMSASASGTVDNPGTHVGANGNVNCLAGILFLHGEEEVNI